MKRLQISLEPELDQELDRAARDQGVSKAEIVRRCLRASLGVLPPLEQDPLIQLFGKFRGGYAEDSERHDEIIDALAFDAVFHVAGFRTLVP